MEDMVQPIRIMKIKEKVEVKVDGPLNGYEKNIKCIVKSPTFQRTMVVDRVPRKENELISTVKELDLGQEEEDVKNISLRRIRVK